MLVDSQTFDYEGALLACAAGDAQALRRIYVQESPRLLGVALRIVRERSLAEDVVHDAFLHIWHSAATFDGARGAARGWMYSIVRHQALNSVRNRAREVNMDEETLDFVQPQSDAAPEAFVELNGHLGKLGTCLEHLDGAKRNSILYAYVDGCSHGEIAKRLGAPLGSVKAWIKRGLAALRECMG